MQRTLLTILLVMAASSPVSAASFCAVNTAQLEAALDAAESNNEDDIIRVQSAIYSVPSGGFDYFPAASDQNNDLEIIGGYGPNIGGPCQSGPFPDPTQTLLSGGLTNRIFRVGLPTQGGDIEIRNFRFTGGVSGGNGSALSVTTALNGDPFPGRLTIENNIFNDNSGFIGGALYIDVEGTSGMNIQVLNNLFFDNSAESNSGAAQISASAPEPAPGVITPLPAVTFAHNTVVSNDYEGSGTRVGGVRLSGDMPNVWVASNNIWANQGRNLQLSNQAGNSVRLWNNNLQNSSITGNPGPDVGNIDNISVVPTYVSCGPLCVDLVPTTDSPLIDSGYAPPPGFFNFRPWELPATDLTGGPRQRGEQVDIGAYEGIPDVMFRDRFED
jgi:hypothetical protein